LLTEDTAIVVPAADACYHQLSVSESAHHFHVTVTKTLQWICCSALPITAKVDERGRASDECQCEAQQHAWNAGTKSDKGRAAGEAIKKIEGRVYETGLPSRWQVQRLPWHAARLLAAATRRTAAAERGSLEVAIKAHETSQLELRKSSGRRHQMSNSAIAVKRAA
jgi:hypothetical protein